MTSHGKAWAALPFRPYVRGNSQRPRREAAILANAALERMAPPAMTEEQLLTAVIELAGYLGVLAYHTHDSRRSQAGFPDLVLAGARRTVFVELKSERGKLTSEQTAWKWRLQAAGLSWYLWRPRDWDSGYISTILRDLV